MKYQIITEVLQRFILLLRKEKMFVFKFARSKRTKAND